MTQDHLKSPSAGDIAVAATLLTALWATFPMLVSLCILFHAEEPVSALRVGVAVVASVAFGALMADQTGAFRRAGAN